MYFFRLLWQKILRLKLIKITNDVIFEKRTGIINKMLNSSYHQLEKVEK